VSERLVVRTWNLFHGNAVPPERRAFLEQMVRLVTEDAPAVVCLQELPVWALRRVEEWSGMTASGVVTKRPWLGSAELGRVLTDLHHGLLRSACTGQANAILVDRALHVADERTLMVSTGGERRVCQSLRVDGRFVVCNFHVTGGLPADGQLVRVVEFAAGQDERVVLAGDANLVPPGGEAYTLLGTLGFSDPAPGIDQIVVRGLTPTPPRAWPEERRRVDGRLLSDHAPVELSVE
jgi:endonuclease/exonuclease/phosphatase family metal-dependent hydrolase